MPDQLFLYSKRRYLVKFLSKKTILSVKKTSRGCRQGKRAVILPAGIQQSPVSPDAPGCRIPGRPGGVQAASMGGKKRQRVCQKQPRMSQPVCRIHSPMGSFWARRKNVIWDFCPLCLVNFPKKGEGRALRHLNPLLRNDLRKSRTGEKGEPARAPEKTKR